MRKRAVIGQFPLPLFLLAGEEDPAGGGGNDPNADPNGGGGNDPNGGGGEPSQEAIQKAVEEATKGLKQNKDQILQEKKDLEAKKKEMEQTFEQLGGQEGINKLIETRKRLENDEMGQLLADGKYEEWFEQRTQAMKSEHQKQVEQLNEQLEQHKQKAESAMQAWTDKVLETDVRAACSEQGVIDSAHEDVMFRAKHLFSWSEDHQQMVLKDEDGGVVLGKDGKSPKAISEWLEEQKDKARHWWPASQGAGANGAMGSKGGPTPEGVARMSMQEYKDFRKKQGLGQDAADGIPG